MGLENKQYHNIKNFATGEVFSQKASQKNVDSEKYGDKTYHEIKKEQL